MLCVLHKRDAFIEKGTSWGAARSARMPLSSRRRHGERGGTTTFYSVFSTVFLMCLSCCLLLV